MDSTNVLARPLNRRRLIGSAAALGLGGSALMASVTRATDRLFQVAGGEVIIAGGGEPKFDPYFLNTELGDVQAQIFRALFDYRGDDPYAINPALAASYEETETTLTLTLRQGVKFHNGRELVAQDVIDNLDRARDATLGHNLSRAV